MASAHSLFSSNDSLVFALERWKGEAPNKPSGLDRVNDALNAVSDALSALGRKPRSEVRAYLEGIRDRLTAARAAYVSFGDYDGPAALALAERYNVAELEVVQARAALKNSPADRAVVTERRIDLDLAEARLAEVLRHVAELSDACTYPQLPDLAAFANAKDAVRSIIALSKHRPARALEVALSLGASVERALANGSAANVARARLELQIAECYMNDDPVFGWTRKRAAEAEDVAEPVATAAE